jgi:hypothetical protein
LLKVARVLKVMAAMAPYRLALIVPKDNKQKVAAMNQVVARFKTVTNDLHDAIALTEPVATRKAAIQLNKTCAACHELR